MRGRVQNWHKSIIYGGWLYTHQACSSHTRTVVNYIIKSKWSKTDSYPISVHRCVYLVQWVLLIHKFGICRFEYLQMPSPQLRVTQTVSQTRLEVKASQMLVKTGSAFQLLLGHFWGGHVWPPESQSQHQICNCDATSPCPPHFICCGIWFVWENKLDANRRQEEVNCFLLASVYFFQAFMLQTAIWPECLYKPECFQQPIQAELTLTTCTGKIGPIFHCNAAMTT